MKLSKAFILVASLLVPAMAQAASSSDNKDNELKQKISDMLGVEVSTIQPSPISGLQQVLTDRGVLYITEDGSKLIHGNVYDLNNRMKNLTEAALAGPRIEMLKPLEKDMLVYKAKNEKQSVRSEERYLYNEREDKPSKRVIFYTDRAIYRPGQKTYFKAVSINEKSQNNYATLAKTELEVAAFDQNNQKTKKGEK